MEAFLVYYSHQRLIVDFTYISAFALLVYDWVLTFHLEVQLIWSKSWSYTTWLFIITRYMPMVDMFFLLHNQVLVGVSAETCARTYPTCAWLLIVGTNIAEIVLTVRTWALWRLNPFVGSFLVLLIAGIFTGHCFITTAWLKSLHVAPPLFPGFRGCFVTSLNDLLKWNFVLASVVQGALISLVSISAYQTYRRGDKSELAYMVHRDGILFYFYLLVVTLVNVYVVTSLPRDLSTMFAPFEDSFYSVFTSRILLNIRGIGTRESPELPSELHSQYWETMTRSVFVPYEPEVLGENHRTRFRLSRAEWDLKYPVAEPSEHICMQSV